MSGSRRLVSKRMFDAVSTPPLLTSWKPDAVYFFMLEGWTHELRSNRWHYAKRWARHLPVVLLQPTQVVASRRRVSRAEGRIPNCTILEIKSSLGEASYLQDTLVQLGQVTHDMEQRGVERPLLWFYNPYLAGLYAAVPAVGRVMHATENYFHFDGLPDFVLDRHRAAIRSSDLVVAVSEGVAASIREQVPDARVVVVTNGCDYQEYSHGTPSPELLAARGPCRLVAIYAGNINARLDYALIRRCVREFRDVLFAFFGPVLWLSGEDARRWDELLHEPNFRHFGAVAADLLPGLYAAADVGLIPYKATRVLIENGFPLKALEMCATGLPVVSTLMKPIEGRMSALAVVRDHDSFVQALGRTSRAALSPEQVEEMRRVCQQHDYDAKFRGVLEAVEGSALGTRHEPGTRWDAAADPVLGAQWTQLGATAWRRSRTVGARLRAVPVRLSSKLGQRRPELNVAGRLGRAPQSAAAKGIITLRLLMADGVLRRLLWTYASDGQARRQVAMADILADLLRLGIIRWHRRHPTAGGSAFDVGVHYEPAERRLSFVSVRRERCGPESPARDDSVLPDAGKLEQIVWDHSAVGRTVAWVRSSGERLHVGLGADGIYEFAAIATLARRDHKAVWRALVACAVDAG
jgi:glycosyl transferase family 1